MARGRARGPSGGSGLDVSVVIPHVDRTASLLETVARLGAALGRAGWTHEVVVVCDGGPDEAWDAVASLAGDDPSVVAIRLEDRHGALNARAVGMAQARGAVIAMADDDLEVDPEVMTELIAAVEDGATVATALRAEDPDRPPARRAGSSLLRALAATVPGRPRDMSSGMRAHRRHVVDAALAAWPARRDIRFGLRLWEVTDDFVEITVPRRPRPTASHYSPTMLGIVMLDAVVALGAPTRWIRPAPLLALAGATWVAPSPPVPARLRGAARVTTTVAVALVAADAALARRPSIPDRCTRVDHAGTTTLVRSGSLFVAGTPGT